MSQDQWLVAVEQCQIARLQIQFELQYDILQWDSVVNIHDEIALAFIGHCVGDACSIDCEQRVEVNLVVVVNYRFQNKIKYQFVGVWLLVRQQQGNGDIEGESRQAD